MRFILLRKPGFFGLVTTVTYPWSKHSKDRCFLPMSGLVSKRPSVEEDLECINLDNDLEIVFSDLGNDFDLRKG
jgi:hypothetical protein